MRPLTAVSRWLTAPVPEARAAVFRLLAYAFVVVDVLRLHTSGEYHGYVDGAWYRPLAIGRVLPLPTPTLAVVEVCKWGSVTAALLAIVFVGSGRGPRRAPAVLGWTVFLLWFEYQVIAFSYGKVDHDRFGFLFSLGALALFGPVRLRSRRWSENAGWVLRCVQLGVVATYFYASIAKLRFGGIGWVNSATVTRAVVRRGTWLSQPLLDHAWTLHLTQYGIMAMELSSPLVFLLNRRWRTRVALAWLGFHAMTYAMITIAFWPHLVCVLAFLPLERLAGVRVEGAAAQGATRLTGPATRPQQVPAYPAAAAAAPWSDPPPA